MAETVFNIFLDFENHRCKQARYTAHDVSLDDTQAIEFLRQRVESDLPNAKIVALKSTFTKAQYDAHCRLGRGIELYDEVFVEAGAGPEPLFVVTPVVDGVVVVDLTGHVGEINSFLTPKVLGGGQMRDWLTHYSTDAGIDIPALIHDDYFLAIKLTYNARLYASSAKLILSCIDSLAFIEFGHTSEPAFVLWLKAYADLGPLAITPEELWELRNGLLHMTNLSSRKLTAQKVRRVGVSDVWLKKCCVSDGCRADRGGARLRDLNRVCPPWEATEPPDSVGAYRSAPPSRGKRQPPSDCR